MTDLHQIWPHRWLNPKAEVKPSPICAKGVFSKEQIKRGEIIRVTGGLILPKSDIDRYNSMIDYPVQNVYLDISDGYAMAPDQHDLNTTATINHSCEPNAGFQDSITIVAIKDIKPGEEIAWDYAMSQTAFPEFECRCGKPSCRKVIRPTDWQIKSIQAKYGQWFSPYLKAKIKL